MIHLSVIIPVYNAAAFLPACFACVLGQTVFDQTQWLLVDDGSTDGSAALCDAFAAEHENAAALHQPNSGVSAARNAGLERAQGVYVGFADADDTFDPDYFEKLLLAAEQTDSDFAFCGITFDHADGRRPLPPFIAGGTVLEQDAIVRDFAQKMLTDGSQNSVCCKVIRRALVTAHGLRFPQGVRIAEDKIFVLSLLPHCRRLVSVDAVGYYYRDVATSAMHSDKKMETLLAADEEELRLFCALGLDESTVREQKSVFLFTELADFLQRALHTSRREAKRSIEVNFANEELMRKIDFALPAMRANGGRVYALLADAFQKRSVPKTMAALTLQKIINDRR